MLRALPSKVRITAGSAVPARGAIQRIRPMLMTSSFRFVLRWALGAALAIAPGSLAHAQFQVPSSDPATGENYHIEAQFGWWNPTPEIVVASESLGILGTRIDLVGDLGIEQTRFKDFRLVGRPARKHRFRFSRTPINFVAETRLARTIVFNGIRFNVNVPVSTTLDFKAYRYGYEYDFVYTDRGFAGFIVEAKHTDVSVTLASPLSTEFARAKAPVPAIGGIGRVYVLENTSITGELTGFSLSWLPDDLVEGNQGKYLEFDLYGTVNFTNNVGAQFGYRKLDVDYLVDEDFGDFNLKGWYFSGVVRF